MCKKSLHKFYKPRFTIYKTRQLIIYEGIYKKLNCYSEQQFNNDKYKNIDIIEKKIFEKKDLFNRDYKYKVVNIDNSFPDFIFKNQERLKDLIYKE